MARGKYIVIEGAEGVGKSTQIINVAKELVTYGYSVQLFSNDIGLANIDGVTTQTLPTLNSQGNIPSELLFYNASRAVITDAIQALLSQGVVCLLDSNYLTVLTRYYYGATQKHNYDTINAIVTFAEAVEPDLTIVLDAPADELIKRAGTNKNDAVDIAMIDRIRAGYLLEAKKHGYPVVFANESPITVFKYVWGYIAALFNNQAQEKDAKIPSTAPPVTALAMHTPENQINTESSADWLKKTKDTTQVTQKGYAVLDTIVSDAHGDVYAFNGSLDQVTVAAAMARLSRRGDDMRVTLLDEFVGKAGKDEGLIQRVVTAYGDDSVQQLVGIHVVVENASNLLTKQIEWGRLAAYLEQSTRYIYYDKKDVNGQYRFYTPKTLSNEMLTRFTSDMEELFDNYSKTVHAITDYLYKSDTTPESERDGAWKSAIRAQACDAARAMLPVAVKSTVGIFASGQALESLIMRLKASESAEARTCGDAILAQARSVMPAFLERADKPERGGATIAYKSQTHAHVAELSKKLLNDRFSTEHTPVTLTAYTPKNELDIVPHMVYEHLDLSEAELVAAARELPYKDKNSIFMAYMGDRLNRRHRPGRALERITYSWDIVCDYGVFRDLQRHRMVSDLTWQRLTPRYGYDIPELVEQAGMADTYLASFDKSLELHSVLTAAGFEYEAQYATLLGHKMRWKVTMNAREAMHFIELRTTPQGHPAYRKIAKLMYDKIAEVHPMVSEAMRFVNKDEDPELTRLAAERYTQFKLNMLDKK